MAKRNLFPQLRRLAFAAQYNEVLNQDTIKGLYAIYMQLTWEELKAKLNDKYLTVAEKQVLINIIEASTYKGKNQLAASKHVEEKTYGKMPEIYKNSGDKNEPPIQMDVTYTAKEALAGMSPDELRDLKKFTMRIAEKAKG